MDNGERSIDVKNVDGQSVDGEGFQRAERMEIKLGMLRRKEGDELKKASEFDLKSSSECEFDLNETPVLVVGRDPKSDSREVDRDIKVLGLNDFFSREAVRLSYSNEWNRWLVEKVGKNEIYMFDEGGYERVPVDESGEHQGLVTDDFLDRLFVVSGSGEILSIRQIAGGKGESGRRAKLELGLVRDEKVDGLLRNIQDKETRGDRKRIEKTRVRLEEGEFKTVEFDLSRDVIIGQSPKVEENDFRKVCLTTVDGLDDFFSSNGLELYFDRGVDAWVLDEVGQNEVYVYVDDSYKRVKTVNEGGEEQAAEIELPLGDILIVSTDKKKVLLVRQIGEVKGKLKSTLGFSLWKGEKAVEIVSWLPKS